MFRKGTSGLIGLVAAAGLLYVFMGKKKAKAAPTAQLPQAQPADLAAQYMAALANVLNTGGSMAEYQRVLQAAYESGAFSQDMVVHYLGKHPDATPEQKRAAQLV